MQVRYWLKRCLSVCQGWGVGVGVGIPQSPGFGPESEALIWRRLRLRALSVLPGLLYNFFAVYLTLVQFILQLKLCLYTTMHRLLEEFQISLKSSLMTQSLCHTISPRVWVGAKLFSARVTVGVPQKKDSTSLVFVCVETYKKLMQLAVNMCYGGS